MTIIKRTPYKEYSDCKVVHIVDGDTMDVMVDQGFGSYTLQRFRLYGIDTPEVYGVKHSSEEYKKGMISSNFVKDRLPVGTKIVIRTYLDGKRKDKKGSRGRYLADIFVKRDDADALDDEYYNLNGILLTEGLAEKYIP